ncbi:MAG TPA: heavy-metal-associated domain-containing protein [bacterium]|nr:heavy-metal-associated domain-containing protein [bacterium]
MQQATLVVPKIHCNGCVSTVTRALQKLPGVQTVEASEVTKQVRVAFDPSQVDETKIRRTLDLIGYPAAG